ncbi:hypothetical protein QCE73_27890, partial [Caballeronia sp. LZ029]|uniref:hypothetical protein n=1 Tax=Caballeronia sp. LZ029 TaxID=3038564 RepID=UPI0028591321
CSSVNRLFLMTSIPPLEAILSSFNWSENRQAGHSDALADLSTLINLDGTVVEKATVSFYFDETPRSLEVAASGMIHGDPDLLESLTPLCARQFSRLDQLSDG